MSKPLTEDQQEALDKLIDAVALVRELSLDEVLLLSEYVEENGTDHEDGMPIDVSVKDALDVIADQM